MTQSAALYARISPDGVTDEDRLKSQLGLLIEYAEVHDCEIMCIYKDLSPGFKEERPALQHLMHDAAAGCFDVVLLLDPTRLFRDLTLCREYYRRLREACGVHVVFVLNESGREDEASDG